ncbi:hexaprenyldihydroxybenzoate methyltransferase mitochondrial precursor [Dipodascopsis tothii]|uniref:hexaprenyldihydroxybenzoate methyltransferase mitochondrial precursor n=1 Tax=Dipodascopsis tothii TaxID=44089 RepID=UPI0034CD6E63
MSARTAAVRARQTWVRTPRATNGWPVGSTQRAARGIRCLAAETQRRWTSSTSSLRSSAGSAPPRGTTSSAEELSHFGELAATWWDTNGSSRLLHKMNPIRLEFMFGTMANYSIPGLSRTSELEVLDVGCGGGILSESLARLPTVKTVTGIDLSPEVIRVAREHKSRDPALFEQRDGRDVLEYELRSITDLAPGSEKQYDVVTLMEMLEHVPNPALVLAEAAARVRPGGWIFLSTINRTAVSYLTTILAAEHILGIVPRGTHTWAKYINASELREWFDGHVDDGRWDVVSVQGCLYVPFAGWKLGGSPTLGNYFLAARKT